MTENPERSTHLRTLASAVLIIIGALAVSAAVATYWLDTVLLDTDTFVAATEPLLVDAGALATTSERISDTLLEKLDVAALADKYVPEFLKPTVDSLAAGFEEIVRTQVSEAVASDGFAALNRARLRAWHTTFASAVTAQGDETTLDGTTLTVTLAPYIDLLAEKTAKEYSLLNVALERVPKSIRDAQVAVLDIRPFADRLPQLRAMSAAQPYLPWIAAIALLGGLVVAPRRDWALLGAGAALIGSGGWLWNTAQSEALRVSGLLSETLGSSVAASMQAVDLLAAPLLGWSTWVMWAGVALAVAGAGWLLWERWRPSGNATDRGEAGVPQA